MIAVDTNVLLRYLLKDDESQFPQAARLITGDEKILITDAVLVETIWTLKGKKYQLTKGELIQTLLLLFQETNIRFEEGQVVWQAINDFRKSKPVRGKEADFADALIINKAKWVIEKKGGRFNGSFTFDKAAQALPFARAPR